MVVALVVGAAWLGALVVGASAVGGRGCVVITGRVAVKKGSGLGVAVAAGVAGAQAARKSIRTGKNFRMEAL